MPKVSEVPGSPQSSTSTVNGSDVVPVDLITSAMPVIVACWPPGAVQAVAGVIDSPSTDRAFIRTSDAWSLYSRFPDAAQHLATKPKVARSLGSLTLGTRAGTDRRVPI